MDKSVYNCNEEKYQESKSYNTYIHMYIYAYKKQ